MTNNQRPLFGPIDPYAVLPAAAFASFAVVLLLNGVVLFGVIVLAVAALIIAFDSWVNRNQRRR